MLDRIPILPPVIEPIIDDQRRPLWSVMIPTYNCIHFIEAALLSVLSQDPGPDLMQIEVIDDHSADGDVASLVQRVGKGRVHFMQQPVNLGSLRNFETCIRRSKGKYVHILHGDDFVLPGFYAKIGELFSKNLDAGAAFSNFQYVDGNGKQIAIRNPILLKSDGIIPDFLNKIAVRQLIQPPAIVAKRETYEKLGSFRGAHFGEDWEMWTRIASKYPVAYTPEILASYRIGHGIGISHRYFLSGQNINDIKSVINLAQEYLPVDKRVMLKKKALRHYSIYCIRIANGLLLKSKKAAFVQVKGALSISRSPATIYWATRFYLMHVLRYKQLENYFVKFPQ